MIGSEYGIWTLGSGKSGAANYQGEKIACEEITARYFAQTSRGVHKFTVCLFQMSNVYCIIRTTAQ